MTPPSSILVRGVNWLGDAVMTTPALLRLREAFPKTRITLLTPEKLAGLWLRHPALDETLTFKPREFPWAIGRRLRPRRFDLAVIFPNSPRSALEIWFAGIPQRVGYARPWRNWLLTCAVAVPSAHVAMRKRSLAEIKRLTAVNAPLATPPPIPSSAHHIHHYLRLAATLGANPAPLPLKIQVSQKEAASFVHRIGAGLRPLFGMVPGAEYGPAKRWPAERFAAAAAEIHRQTGCLWVLFGSSGDATVTAHIAELIRASCPSDSPCIDLAGATSLHELCAGLKSCRMLLTNDTGAMHVAAAVGTPVVALFGSTSPELTGPSIPGDKTQACLTARVPCSPCFLRECPIDFRCMTSVTVAAVVKQMTKTA
jgi:heptosyltransferase II